MYYLLGESLQKFLEEQQRIQKENLEKQRQVLLSQKEQNQEQEMEYQRQLELAFKLGLKEQDPEMTSEYKEEIISCKEVLGLKMIKNEQI